MNKLTKSMNISYRESMEYLRFKAKFPRMKVQQLDIPIYTGDFIQVVKGPEKGKYGKVLTVFRSLNWIYVRALNMKVQKIRDKENKEKYLLLERPFLADEVQLLEPDNKSVPTKVSIGVTPSGYRVRVSENTGKVILYPKEGDPYLVGAYAYKPGYTDGPHDTKPEDVLLKTYKPTLNTLEEEVALTYKDWIRGVLKRTGWIDVLDRVPTPPPPRPKRLTLGFPLPYLDVVKIERKKDTKKENKITRGAKLARASV